MAAMFRSGSLEVPTHVVEQSPWDKNLCSTEFNTVTKHAKFGFEKIREFSLKDTCALNKKFKFKFKDTAYALTNRL
jgi:hypothetical protein